MNLQQPTARLRPFRPIQFGRYTLLAPIGAGGMGEVFLARMEGARGFEKFCVIKKILPSLAAEGDFLERFVSEARILGRLAHGSIAQVLDVGLHEGDPYIALEHVDGKDLRKVALRMRERHLPPPLTFVLYVTGRVLDALAYAHRKRDDEDRELNLVHRDVSPQNILVSYEGEVKIIDFGLAKSTLSISKTNPSIVLGKFLYMSPEQARHQQVDRRSDLYSVGLCMYELITGKNPFDSCPPGELMAQVADPKISPLQEVDPLCPGAVSAMVMKALAVEPMERFQTAEEFRGKVLAALHEIDSNAGPETVSKFMRETFASEYQAERRLLASVKDVRPAPLPRTADTGVHVMKELGPEPTSKKNNASGRFAMARGSGPVPVEEATEAAVPVLPPAPVSSPKLVPLGSKPVNADADLTHPRVILGTLLEEGEAARAARAQAPASEPKVIAQLDPLPPASPSPGPNAKAAAARSQPSETSTGNETTLITAPPAPPPGRVPAAARVQAGGLLGPLDTTLDDGETLGDGPEEREDSVTARAPLDEDATSDDGRGETEAAAPVVGPPRPEPRGKREEHGEETHPPSSRSWARPVIAAVVLLLLAAVAWFVWSLYVEVANEGEGPHAAQGKPHPPPSEAKPAESSAAAGQHAATKTPAPAAASTSTAAPQDAAAKATEPQAAAGTAPPAGTTPEAAGTQAAGTPATAPTATGTPAADSAATPHDTAAAQEVAAKGAGNPPDAKAEPGADPELPLAPLAGEEPKADAAAQPNESPKMATRRKNKASKIVTNFGRLKTLQEQVDPCHKLAMATLCAQYKLLEQDVLLHSNDPAVQDKLLKDIRNVRTQLENKRGPR